MNDEAILIIYTENNQYKIEALTPSSETFNHVCSTEDELHTTLKKYKSIIYDMDLRLQQDVKMENGTSLLERAIYILFDR